MGKNLIQQARGKGGPSYRSPGFRFVAAAKHRALFVGDVNGKIIDIVHCPGHYAPLVKMSFDDGVDATTIAAEGIRVGEVVSCGSSVELKPGNIIPLKDIPEGTLVHNIELIPGDGGKIVRSSGTFARVSAKLKDKVLVLLPSKKQKEFAWGCRASIGIVAGGGRVDKPFLKAGTRHFKKRARNKRYPMISGCAQNAVDHPFGNKRTLRKSKARPISRNAPPGRKVGMIAARRTGRKK